MSADEPTSHAELRPNGSPLPPAPTLRARDAQVIANIGRLRFSPLSLVGNVSTPTLVVVGEQDFRTPVSDSEQYYEALKLRGIPTALVKVPGASHGGLAARPSQSAAKASAILAWFQRYRAAPQTASAH